MRGRDATFAAGIVALVLLLLLAGAAVAAGWLAAAPVSAALRGGASAGLLGALQAWRSGAGSGDAVPAWRRLAFPPLAVLLNVMAVRTALWLGAVAELAGLPLSAGPAAASGLFAGLYVQVSWRWLGLAPDRRRTMLAVLAGVTAFAALVLLRRASAGGLHYVLLLTIYWALWSALVAAVWARPPAPLPAGKRGPGDATGIRSPDRVRDRR